MAGNRRPMRTAMMAITTRSSIRVKPSRTGERRERSMDSLSQTCPKLGTTAGGKRRSAATDKSKAAIGKPAEASGPAGHFVLPVDRLFKDQSEKPDQRRAGTGQAPF